MHVKQSSPSTSGGWSEAALKMRSTGKFLNVQEVTATFCSCGCNLCLMDMLRIVRQTSLCCWKKDQRSRRNIDTRTGTYTTSPILHEENRPWAINWIMFKICFSIPRRSFHAIIIMCDFPVCVNMLSVFFMYFHLTLSWPAHALPPPLVLHTNQPTQFSTCILQVKTAGSWQV